MKRSEALQEFVLAASTLTSMVERRSFHHALSVAELCRKVGETQGLGPLRMRHLMYAALLHDIGEITLSEKILDKKGQLTAKERRIMENHTVVGYKVVSKIPTLEPSACLIRWHHENLDGTGYPDALEGDAIPLEASI
ncbi:MAG: HD-GYP domain-containing protein, partial [bacterium]